MYNVRSFETVMGTLSRTCYLNSFHDVDCFTEENELSRFNPHFHLLQHIQYSVLFTIVTKIYW